MRIEEKILMRSGPFVWFGFVADSNERSRFKVLLGSMQVIFFVKEETVATFLIRFAVCTHPCFLHLIWNYDSAPTDFFFY